MTRRVKLNPPPRGFERAEFEARAVALQQTMATEGWDAALFTTAADICYFTGFLTRFFLSPTRPWFVVVPAKGMPVAVAPRIGESAMSNAHLGEVLCWESPQPQDEGVSLLADVVHGLPLAHGVIAAPLGAESTMRMPQNDFDKLRRLLKPMVFADCSAAVSLQRMKKSRAEIDKIRYAAQTTSAAFAALPQTAAAAKSEIEICRAFEVDVLARGADSLPYLAAASGAGGYDSVITPPTSRRLQNGDVMMIDAGAVYDGYYCDFCRNYATPKQNKETTRAHESLHESLREGFAAARPGKSAEDVWRAMDDSLRRAGYESGGGGRSGHGVGLQLTEPPSLMRGDNAELKAGYVLALEPSLSMPGNSLMVREENIAVTETGAEWLSDPARAEMFVFGND